MCGSNSDQTDVQAQEAVFSKQMMQENSTVFGQQQSILSGLNAGFQKIIAAGPSQQGFSADELNNDETTASESVAGNMTKASQALGAEQNASGGGDTFIPSGAKEQQQEELAATGASTDAGLREQITQANYDKGNANYNNAVAGSETVAGDLSPTSYGQVTNTSNSNQADEANAIAASANAPFTAVMGALGGVAGAAAGGYATQLAKNHP